MEELIPCPFCGGDFLDKSYDRGIVFQCTPCGYRRVFPGLLTPKETPVRVPHKDKSIYEYYNANAEEEAIKKMNIREADHE